MLTANGQVYRKLNITWQWKNIKIDFNFENNLAIIISLVDNCRKKVKKTLIIFLKLNTLCISHYFTTN